MTLKLTGRLRFAAALAILLIATALAGGRASRADEIEVRHGDLTLLGNLIVAEDAALSDGAVLMVHGTLAHHGIEIMATLQELLAERGLSSLAATLSLGQDRRRGTFDCAVPHRYRHEDALDEIDAWVAWLKQRGAERVALLGHSRGGNQVAWSAAERSDPAVRAVILLAPATWDAEAAAADYEARHGQSLAPLLTRAKGMAPDASMEKVGFLYCPEATVTAATFLSHYRDEPRRDTPRLLPRIALPTLVIAGSADETVPGLEARVAPHLDADTRLAVVEDADHFFRDLFADEVADLIEAFLADVDEAS